MVKCAHAQLEQKKKERGHAISSVAMTAHPNTQLKKSGKWTQQMALALEGLLKD